MRISLLAVILLASASATVAVAAKPVHHRTARHSVSHGITRTSYSRSARSSGIDSERASQIQSALIKQGYLNGEPTGTWDSRTVSAMQKLQGDNGWQTKVTPDARALIKLGLGPQSNVSAQPAP
jgi:peptidoglycan hydrolase-like protein with peptidoglycan-binding domain